MNLWVSLSGRSLLYEVTPFCYQCGKCCFSQCVSAVRELCVSQSVRIRPFFLCSQKVLKYADTNIIEFQSSRRNILKKIHTNIFVLKSSVLKCFCCVSHLPLHDPSDFMSFMSVNLHWMLIYKWLMLAICYDAYKLLQNVKLPFVDDRTNYLNSWWTNLRTSRWWLRND